MKLLLLMCLMDCFLAIAQSSSGTFNVLNYGAMADGISDDSKAFMAAWKEACSFTGGVKLLIPKLGTYLVGPVKFDGPCRNVSSITVSMEGYMKASTNLSKYVSGDDWIQFGWVHHLTLTGGGTFDGQGALSWPFNECSKTEKCKVLPSSIKFVYTEHTVVKSIKSLNSKFFHIVLLGCKNFWGSNIVAQAPSDSPNTDGFHIERSSGVNIYNSVITTGDDCISIGQSNEQVVISGITCGPGHGISVGSLGRYENEGDVKGLLIKDCTLSGTTNGLRIKTWKNSPGKSSVSNLTFRNIILKSVANPIIIDQAYCPYADCSSKVPSLVSIRDIIFSDIRGTSTTPVAVALKCSSGVPCENVILHDVHLRYVGGSPTIAECLNVKATYSGTQLPLPCN